MPAFSAGDPGDTAGAEESPVTSTQEIFGAFAFSAISGVTETYRIPRNERLIAEYLATESTMPFTIFSESGIANPMPFAPWVTAVLIPTTRPERSTSGPQELPGLMAVSVWMSQESSCEPPEDRSQASMERPRPDTTPNVSVFWNSVRALPIATTKDPTDKSPVCAMTFTGTALA